MARKKADKRRASVRRRPPGRPQEIGSLPVAQADAPPALAWITRFFAGRRASWAYVVRFGVIAGVLLSFYYFPYDEHGVAAALLRRYLAIYARLAGAALFVFDRGVHVSGTHILGRFNLDFAMNCDAMDVYVLFSAAVLSVPSSWRSRLLGLGLGLLVLVAINVARIVSLYWVGVHFPLLFDFCHVDLWPIVIIASTCAGFLIWARAAGVGREVAPNAHQP
jgi:exosortase/archaeosortase family protein